MRAFYLAYAQETPISAQPVPKLKGADSARPVPEMSGARLPGVVECLPWGHNVVLLFKIKDPAQRLWYAQQTIEHGWSRNVLVHQIESGLFERQGKAVTNFRTALPPPQSDLAAQVLAFAGVRPRQPMDGAPFWDQAVGGKPGGRTHVTVGWGSAMTVVDSDWWMNCKANGRGVFLHRVIDGRLAEANEAEAHPDVCRDLFARGVADAGGRFPDYIMRLAENEADAPGCSELAVRW